MGDIEGRLDVVPPSKTYGSWTTVVTKALRDSNPALKFSAAFSDLSDKVYMSPTHCLIYVARRVADARQSWARNKWIGGRIYNWMTGCEAEYVILSGAVLGNSLEWIGESVPEGLPRGADIRLPFAVAEALDADLRAKAKAEGIAI